jgi:hypothetical protein
MTYSLELYSQFIELKTVSFKQDILPATVLQFMYEGKERYAIVLTPNWLDKLHAIQIKDIGPVKLIELLEELKGFAMAEPEDIQGAFTRAEYVDVRPYRTFTLNKIVQIKQVILKEPDLQLDVDNNKKVEVNELKTLGQQLSNEELNNE